MHRIAHPGSLSGELEDSYYIFYFMNCKFAGIVGFKFIFLNVD
jgi:hypothetical protein